MSICVGLLAGAVVDLVVVLPGGCHGYVSRHFDKLQVSGRRNHTERRSTRHKEERREDEWFTPSSTLVELMSSQQQVACDGEEYQNVVLSSAAAQIAAGCCLNLLHQVMFLNEDKKRSLEKINQRRKSSLVASSSAAVSSVLSSAAADFELKGERMQIYITDTASEQYRRYSSTSKKNSLIEAANRATALAQAAMEDAEQTDDEAMQIERQATPPPVYNDIHSRELQEGLLELLAIQNEHKATDRSHSAQQQEYTTHKPHRLGKATTPTQQTKHIRPATSPAKSSTNKIQRRSSSPHKPPTTPTKTQSKTRRSKTPEPQQPISPLLQQHATVMNAYPLTQAAVPAVSGSAAPRCPPSPPKSTIATYIHRFRHQPPLSPIERQQRLLEQQKTHTEFWWQNKQAETGMSTTATQQHTASPIKPRLSLHAVIDQLMNEEQQRIAAQIQQQQTQMMEKSTQTAVQKQSDHTHTEQQHQQAPVHHTALPATVQQATALPASSLSAPPSVVADSATANHENILRLARELNLSGLAQQLSMQLKPTQSVSTSNPVLNPVLPVSHFPQPYLPSPIAATNTAVNPPTSMVGPVPSLFSSLLSSSVSTSSSNVDVDDLLARWRKANNRDIQRSNRSISAQSTAHKVADSSSNHHAHASESRSWSPHSSTQSLIESSPSAPSTAAPASTVSVSVTDVDQVVERVMQRLQQMQRQERKEEKETSMTSNSAHDSESQVPTHEMQPHSAEGGDEWKEDNETEHPADADADVDEADGDVSSPMPEHLHHLIADKPVRLGVQHHHRRAPVPRVPHRRHRHPPQPPLHSTVTSAMQTVAPWKLKPTPAQWVDTLPDPRTHPSSSAAQQLEPHNNDKPIHVQDHQHVSNTSSAASGLPPLYPVRSVSDSASSSADLLHGSIYNVIDRALSCPTQSYEQQVTAMTHKQKGRIDTQHRLKHLVTDEPSVHPDTTAREGDDEEIKETPATAGSASTALVYPLTAADSSDAAQAASVSAIPSPQTSEMQLQELDTADDRSSIVTENPAALTQQNVEVEDRSENHDRQPPNRQTVSTSTIPLVTAALQIPQSSAQPVAAIPTTTEAAVPYPYMLPGYPQPYVLPPVPPFAASFPYPQPPYSLPYHMHPAYYPTPAHYLPMQTQPYSYSYPAQPLSTQPAPITQMQAQPSIDAVATQSAASVITPSASASPTATTVSTTAAPTLTSAVQSPPPRPHPLDLCTELAVLLVDMDVGVSVFEQDPLLQELVDKAKEIKQQREQQSQVLHKSLSRTSVTASAG